MNNQQTSDLRSRVEAALSAYDEVKHLLKFDSEKHRVVVSYPEIWEAQFSDKMITSYAQTIKAKWLMMVDEEIDYLNVEEGYINYVRLRINGYITAMACLIQEAISKDVEFCRHLLSDYQPYEPVIIFDTKEGFSIGKVYSPYPPYVHLSVYDDAHDATDTEYYIKRLNALTDLIVKINDVIFRHSDALTYILHNFIIKR